MLSIHPEDAISALQKSTACAPSSQHTSSHPLAVLLPACAAEPLMSQQTGPVAASMLYSGETPGELYTQGSSVETLQPVWEPQDPICGEEARQSCFTVALLL